MGRFYNKRGRAEQWIKEGKEAAHWTRLSCHRFRANKVWRRLGLPSDENCSRSAEQVVYALRDGCRNRKFRIP